jgi:hypothetical protein
MIGEVEQEPFVCYFHCRYILELKLTKIYVEDYLDIVMYLHTFFVFVHSAQGFCQHLDRGQDK